jgi:hypothetical protein
VLIDDLPEDIRAQMFAKLNSLVQVPPKKQQPPKTLTEQYQLLSKYYWEWKLDWIQFLRGYITTMFEERGNISVNEDRKDPYKRWRSGQNTTASTALCLAPIVSDDKKGKQPEKAAKGNKLSEGYVYFQMPSWLKGCCGRSGRPSRVREDRSPPPRSHRGHGPVARHRTYP